LRGSGAGVWAEAAENSEKPEKSVAKKIGTSFITQILASAAVSGKLAGIRRQHGGSLPFQFLPLNFFMPERVQKPVEPVPWGPKQGDGGGPRSPDVSRPDTKDLLKKMRKVDPNQSKRYRQRTGQ
jgi:hypothetical protein